MQTPNESLLTLDKVCCKRINESCFPSRPTFFFFFFFPISGPDQNKNCATSFWIAISFWVLISIIWELKSTSIYL